MKSCPSLFFGSIIGIIAFFCSSGFVKANEIFNEDFSSSELNSTYWNVNINPGGTVDILQNSILHLSSINGRYSPYVYLQDVTIPDNDYRIYTKFKFSGPYNYGGGIIFSTNLLQNATTMELKEGDAVFHVWPGPNGIGISSSVCSQDSLDCIDSQNSKIITSVAVDTWNVFEIYSDNTNTYRLYLNGDLIYTSKPSSQKISNIWFGNPVFLSNYTKRPDIFIDYLSIFTPDVYSTFHTIIIPGLGASWDAGAILSGNEGGSWQIPNFVKIYDGLINSFINAGYSETGSDTNLFVFPYDWRKPLSVLAERLNTFIDTNIPAGEKVNLVGHSMGGLVARTYAQNYGISKVNKIVTIGSPNMGTVKAYGIWEGATIWDDVWWGKVALDLSTHFGGNSGESSVQTVQRLVPSIKDLLPTYDYLKLNDSLLSWTSLTQKNDYLNDLNLNASQINSLTTAIYSKDFGTDSLIRVVAHTLEDLDLWIDGKPVPVNPFETALGDGTVTETSAKGLFTNSLQGTGWHGELVTKNDNIQKIFGVLGLDPLKALSGVDESRKKVFVAALRSPGVLEVCNIEITRCNDQLGLYFPENKLFMLPGYNDENLVVRVTEDDMGAYKLHLGNIDNTSNWTVVSGNLERDDQVDFYNVQSNNQVISATLTEPELPDTTPPSVPTDGQPNGSYLSTNEFDFIWGASTDNKDGEISYEYQASLIPLEVGGILTTNLWHSPIPLISPMIHSSGAPDGTWYWQVRAKDTAGNDSAWSQIWNMTIDSIKPSLRSKTIFSGWYKTPQTSIFTYTDTNLKNDYQNPTCEISSEGLSQICEITPSICDQAGNCNTDLQTSNGVNIDMTAPKSIFTLPTLSNNWRGIINGTATDNASGVAKVGLIIKNPKGKTSTVAVSGTTSWSYTIPKLVDGVYLIKSRATDVIGNVESELIEQQIVLDTKAPNAPKIIFANDWSQKIWLFWSPVKTANHYRIYYGLKKNELTNMTETNNPFWVSDVLSLGKYYVSVTAIDEAGNESAKSNIIQVNVDKKWKW